MGLKGCLGGWSTRNTSTGAGPAARWGRYPLQTSRGLGLDYYIIISSSKMFRGCTSIRDACALLLMLGDNFIWYSALLIVSSNRKRGSFARSMEANFAAPTAGQPSYAHTSRKVRHCLCLRFIRAASCGAPTSGIRLVQRHRDSNAGTLGLNPASSTRWWLLAGACASLTEQRPTATSDRGAQMPLDSFCRAASLRLQLVNLFILDCCT